VLNSPKFVGMRIGLLLLILLPSFVFAQPKRTLAVKKNYEKGVDAYNAGDFTGALALFEQCVSQDSTYSEAYLNISYITFDQKNYIKSLVNVKKAMKYNLFEPSIFVQAGKCFFHLEEYDSATYFLQKGISYGAKSESDYLYLAKGLTNLGNCREAIHYYSKAIELNTQSTYALIERGGCYFNLGDYELAKNDFEAALKINPKSVPALSGMASASLAMEDPETALTFINQGIESANTQEKVQLYILKGNYYKSIGNLEEAMLSFDAAFALDNQNPIVLNNQATIFIEQENYQSAFEKCNEALDLNPEMMEAYFNRGIANEMLRNVEDACMDWEQAFILGSAIAEEYLNSPVCNE
jgi:tetratricopeptide (TPR) repeat protein